MKLLVFTLLITLSSFSLAQPSFYTIRGDLNKITDEQIEKCLADSRCQLSITITEETDLSRLYLVKDFETLKFLFQLKSVPTKFNEIQFKKLNYVEIDCNNSVKNLKNISGFKNVKFCSSSS